jgi:hypothetical protein
MKSKATRSDQDRQKAAEELVKKILVKDFGQSVDHKTLVAVAERVKRALPDLDHTQEVPA